jgi:demethylmenaquinone methyltransferase / 2-methoxy-6-polyprenyl-1,4-benzoquinol methylase
MSNSPHDPITPYHSNESKKEQVGKMFDGIAPFYDFLNRFLSLGIDITWRRKGVKMLKSSGQYLKIIDVATGTADLAIEAARQMNPQQIIGVDIANAMLDIGRKKIVKKELNPIIELEFGDSENLRFQTGEFDAAMCAFGVRNFENLEKGLSEISRVLRPNGCFLILEFSRPRNIFLKSLYNIYFKYVVPVIGKLRSNDQNAYQYLYESAQKFPDYENFAAVLSHCGFSNISYKPLTFGICTAYLAYKN